MLAATIEFDAASGTWQYMSSGGSQGGTGFSGRSGGAGTGLGFGDAAPRDSDTPVPEPASILIWCLLAGVLVWLYRREQRGWQVA